MGETLGHVTFLVIGIVIGAVILSLLLFIICYLGGMCGFISPPCNTPPAVIQIYPRGECSQHAQTCGYVMPLTGSNLTGASQYQGCCNGLTCTGGYCRQPGEICMTGGQLCGTGPSPSSNPIPDYYGECCSGYQCVGGYCKTPSSCASQGANCNYDSDCCSGLTCSDGKCIKECTRSGSCASNADCCSGYSCNMSTYACFINGCGLSGYYPCYSDNDCCQGLTCMNGTCGSPTKLCSQITPQTPSDCNPGLCSGGQCHYLPATHQNSNSSQPIVENAKCWCDLCVQTPSNSDSIWVKGNCNNGTVANTDYCDQEGGEILHNSRCFNYTTYIQVSGTDTAFTGYPLSSCTMYTVNCSQYNAACRDGACVNITCKTSGICTRDSDCCSSYYCNPNGNCAVIPTCRYESATCTNTSECCHGLECRSGQCWPPCHLANSPCSVNSDCCQGYSCYSGYCSPSCVDTTITCANTSQCCPGDYCHYDNTCHSSSCNSLGGSCTTNTGCCSPYACVNGTCSTPPTCQTSGRCNTDTDCCSNYYCNSNYYCSICMTAGSCTQNSQCCEGYCSNNGYCSSQSCKMAGGNCALASDCCYGMICKAGTCSA